MSFRGKLSGEFWQRVAAVVCGLLAGAMLMVLIGENPAAGYSGLIRGAFMSAERTGNTLATATPLIFTGLSVAFAFKTGLFNLCGRTDVDRRVVCYWYRFIPSPA